MLGLTIKSWSRQLSSTLHRTLAPKRHGTHLRKLSTHPTPLLLTPGQVHELTQSHEQPVSILDASWFMPNSPRNAKEEYLARRIPRAQFLDLDEVASTHELGLKHMMPSERVFAEACETLGIQPASHIIIYDTHGVFSSPRALFMLRTFGHEKSSILDGGLPRWIADGYSVDSGSSPVFKVPKTKYPPPAPAKSTIRSYDQMVENSALDASDKRAELVLDARSRGRFLGTDPEPRPALPSGHIPGSFSLPFDTLLERRTGVDGLAYTVFQPRERVMAALERAVGPQRTEMIISGKVPVVATCGSGMTAGVIWLGLKILGVNNCSLYDESWAGYALRSQSKIEKSL